MTSQTIKRVLREGDSIPARGLRLYYRRKAAASAELACIVSKKVHPHATVRHRYQRVLREVGRRLLEEHPGYDMVIVATPEILQLKKLPDLERSLEPFVKNLIPNSKLKT